MKTRYGGAPEEVERTIVLLEQALNMHPKAPNIQAVSSPCNSNNVLLRCRKSWNADFPTTFFVITKAAVICPDTKVCTYTISFVTVLIYVYGIKIQKNNAWKQRSKTTPLHSGYTIGRALLI